MRSPNSLPPRSTSAVSVSSTPPGSAAPAGTADALQGPQAGAGPSTAPRVGQRRSAQQAGLDGPPLREAPALRQSGQAHPRSAAFGTAAARPALPSPQEMADLQTLLGTPGPPVQRTPDQSYLPSRRELSELAALLDVAVPFDSGPMNSPLDGRAPSGTGHDHSASAALPVGPLDSGGFLPPLEQLMESARHGLTHEDTAVHGEVSSAPPRSQALAAGMPQSGAGASGAQQAPRRPTTPELLEQLREQNAATNRTQRSEQTSALNRVLPALRQAVQDPQRTQALEGLGISLRSHGLDAQGQPVSRQSQLTPLLEQAERRAREHLQGLSNADMTPLDRAIFTAAILREQMGQEETADGQQRALAQPVDETRRAKVLAALEGGQLNRLAAAYTATALGLDAATTEFLLQRAASKSSSPSQRIQLKLRQLSERQGPLAVALVHQLYDSRWVNGENAATTEQGQAKPRNQMPSLHRNALIEALLAAEPGVMQRLIDAAHRPDPNAMAQVCRSIEAAAADGGTTRNRLDNALERLRGRDSRLQTLAGAPPAGQALQWLQTKAPSAATP
jgi:hypothetical protein